MTRKEMIETIAKESGCSKRHIRKILFNRYLELKKINPRLLFYKAFLDKNTDWHNFNVGEKDWRRPNQFDVFCVPSGCVVIFKNIDEIYKNGDIIQTDCGARLYKFKTCNCGR